MKRVKIVELLKNRDLTYEEIAQLSGSTYQSVRMMAYQHDQERVAWEAAMRLESVEQELRELATEAMQLYREGCSYAVIGDNIGRTARNVYRLLNRFYPGRERRSTNPGRPVQTPDAPILAALAAGKGIKWIEVNVCSNGDRIRRLKAQKEASEKRVA